MIKLVSFVCLALVTCQPANALWPFTGQGERSSSASPVYSEADALNLVNIPAYTGVQYFDASDPQVAAQQQQPMVVSELTQAQPDITVEHKTNYGTKGISRFLTRNKSKKQSDVAQSVPLLPETFASNPDQFITSGYLEPTYPVAPNITPEVTKGNKIRSYLPWNWVFVRSQKYETGQAIHEAQPVTPKRSSWSILPPYRPAVVVPNTRPQPYCQCYPVYSYPGYNPVPTPLEVTTPPYTENHGSNVHAVSPSGDGFEVSGSDPVPKVVPPPQSNPHVSGTQQPIQTVHQQQHSTSEQIVPLPSTGVNEQSAVHQVAPSQQVPYAQYHGSGSVYHTPVNQQTIPTASNFHAANGDTSPNGQVSNAK